MPRSFGNIAVKTLWYGGSLFQFSVTQTYTTPRILSSCILCSCQIHCISFSLNYVPDWTLVGSVSYSSIFLGVCNRRINCCHGLIIYSPGRNWRMCFNQTFESRQHGPHGCPRRKPSISIQYCECTRFSKKKQANSTLLRQVSHKTSTRGFHLVPNFAKRWYLTFTDYIVYVREKSSM